MRIRHQSTSRNARRRGYVLVLFVLCLVPLFGMVGLAIDMGLMMVAYREAQNAADSGAMAGAVELANGGSTSTVVQEATRFVHNMNGATVPSGTPPVVGPASGPYKNNTNYVEVYASVSVNTVFLHMLGYSGSQTVQARAVAGLNLVILDAGVVALNKNASGALTVAGNGTLSVSGGPIVVDSSSSSAVQASGNHSQISAPTINITGGDQGSGGVITGTVNTGVAATSNPFAYLTAPTGLTTQSNTQLSGSSSRTIQPGIYTGGISWTGGTLTLSPGTYYINGGGFSVTGNASLTGNGVTIYNAPASTQTSQDINIAGNGTLSLTPPASGTYQGLTIFQASGATNTVSIAGNGATNSIQGTIYAPSAPVSLSGNGTLTVAQIVSDTLNVSGNGTDVVNDTGNTALTPVIFLVE